MRLRGHVPQRETAQHATDRNEGGRHHVLDALALGREQRRNAIEEQRETEEIEQSVADAEPGHPRQVRDREIEDPAEQDVAAQHDGDDLQDAEPE